MAFPLGRTPCWPAHGLQPFPDWRTPLSKVQCCLTHAVVHAMQYQELDRLRELLARKVERRRQGSWRLVRKLAGFLSVLRLALRGLREMRGK
jgi:hypothetical protein